MVICRLGGGGYCFAGGLANACSEAPSRQAEIYPRREEILLRDFLAEEGGVIVLGGVVGYCFRVGDIYIYIYIADS